jgi:hypothetical protein
METRLAIDDIFETARSQKEALVRIYKLYFPDWDAIKLIHGWPACSQEMWSYVCRKFQDLDRKCHPKVIPGGAWMNHGFSSNSHLKGWEVDTATSQVEYKEGRYGAQKNRSVVE